MVIKQFVGLEQQFIHIYKFNFFSSQKYLSQLADESLKEGERDGNPGTEEEVGIIPQFDMKKPNTS